MHELVNVPSTLSKWHSHLSELPKHHQVACLTANAMKQPVLIEIKIIDLDANRIEAVVLNDADQVLSKRVFSKFYCTCTHLVSLVVLDSITTQESNKQMVYLKLATEPHRIVRATTARKQRVQQPNVLPTTPSTPSSPFPKPRQAPFLNSVYSRYRERVAQNRDLTFHQPPNSTNTAQPRNVLESPIDPPRTYVQPELRSSSAPTFFAQPSFSNRPIQPVQSSGGCRSCSQRTGPNFGWF